MKPKLYYAGEPGDGFGWGVCNANLIRALGKLDGVELVDEVDADTVVFMPIADHGLRPSSESRGWKNLGYCFFEYPLEECAAENAKLYDLIFCGSTWCQERLRERGITNTRVLVQGVDTEIFNAEGGTAERNDGEVRIFSGGKFEYRKGQDLVLAAFREVLKSHPRARLVTAWQNPFPATIETMAESKHIKLPAGAVDPWDRYLGRLCEVNGIPKDRVLTLDRIAPNRQMAGVYRGCDFGVFPNRCEGGTNLVMMEFMACGKAVVATPGTGHLDVWNDGMIPMWVGTDVNGWTGAVLHLLPGIIRELIQSPKCRSKGELAGNAMKQWTWERAARTIVAEL